MPQASTSQIIHVEFDSSKIMISIASLGNTPLAFDSVILQLE
jgi:hypothetical protein